MTETKETLEHDGYFDSLFASHEDIELFLKVDGEGPRRNVPADLSQRLLADLNALRLLIMLAMLRADPEIVEMPDGRFAHRERLAEINGIQ